MVIKDTLYKLYYSGHDGQRWKVALATSTNGIRRTKYPDNPILSNSPDSSWDNDTVYGVSVVPLALNDYRMWYSGRTFDLRSKIGYATSPLTTTRVSEPTESPQTHKLYQSYPNPFNPQTIIEFEIPKEDHVVIKIFNSLGQEVTTLVDGRLGPGHYSSAWRADKFSSGVYRYRMTAGGNTETKRMMLLK